MRRFLVFLLIWASLPDVFGQTKLNWGLRHPQEPAEWPVSRVASGLSTARLRKAGGHGLRHAGDGHYVIQGGWKLAPSSMVGEDPFAGSPDNWYDAIVPGTILTTLVHEGVFPDPYYGIDNLSIPDTLCRTDWWYRTSFRIPPEESGRHVRLLFDGINYRADVWLNGRWIGRIDGAFCRGDFDVTGAVAEGDNSLAVRILPPPNPGIPHEQTLASGAGANGGLLCLDGPTFISSEGWDWMPGIRDRNMGIWQEVRLSFSDGIRIIDPRIITDLPLPDTTSVRITVKATVENMTAHRRRVRVSGDIEQVHFEQELEMAPRSRTEVSFTPDEYGQLEMRNPRLWWPNNLGRQELYYLDLKAGAGERISHAVRTRFGIREYSYELTADVGSRRDVRLEYSPTDAMGCGAVFDNLKRRQRADRIQVPAVRDGVASSAYSESGDRALEPYLVLKVNGVRLFCRGGNWGMDDAMKHVSREHLEPYFRLHRDAHVNMIRNWTGESTEEVFYSLCDEYGMVVFNDFWASTEGFNLDVADEPLFLANATDVVRRYRNHPSIAFWNARNEGFVSDWLEMRLNDMVAAEDGTRHYQPNSRFLNLRPSGPWNYMKNPVNYYTKLARGFSTELGTPSVPTAESMLAMMAPEDAWPIGDVWAYHDLHGGQKEYCRAIADKYGDPTDLKDFCRKAQMINYDSHRAVFEAWNSRMWTGTSGILLWMTHPAWPSTVWQMYSWDYETHGAYFGVRKACEPLHVQVNPVDSTVQVVNAELRARSGVRVVHQLYDMYGKLVSSHSRRMALPANRVTDCFPVVYPAQLTDVYLERVSMYDSQGRELSLNDYWRSRAPGGSFRDINALMVATLKARVTGRTNDRFVFELRNVSDVPAIALKLNLREPESGARILPACFSDGYFTLLPGESRTITLEADGKRGYVSVEGYNVPGQKLVWIK